MKIYGGDVVPSKPYVTLLVSMSDRAERLLAEVVEKYGLDNLKGDFVLVEVCFLRIGIPISRCIS